MHSFIESVNIRICQPENIDVNLKRIHYINCKVLLEIFFIMMQVWSSDCVEKKYLPYGTGRPGRFEMARGNFVTQRYQKLNHHSDLVSRFHQRVDHSTTKNTKVSQH